MSEPDTWSKLQAHKRKQDSLRERLAKRRKERQGLLDPSLVTNESLKDSTPEDGKKVEDLKKGSSVKSVDCELGVKTVDDIEKLLSLAFGEKQVKLPISAHDLRDYLVEHHKARASYDQIITVLDKLEAQNFISLKRTENQISVLDCEYTKLKAVHGKFTEGSKEDRSTQDRGDLSNTKTKELKTEADKKDDVATLLSIATTKEVENKQLGSEILDLLNQPTAKELSLVEKFKSQGGAMVREFCQFGTREDCRKSNTQKGRCKKLHFRKIIQAHTDELLGDCSFLNTCFHMDTCKYVHYEVDTRGMEEHDAKKLDSSKTATKSADVINSKKITMTPAQWIQCDVRYLDFDVLGKFSVVMADPPWDIHMELPYGTMSDHEMKALPVAKLTDNGYIFLWVTGRAIELGRECLQIWGYQRCDELIWVKTNQLQRLIRTGRTGHWINHGKEHCIIGVKGRPDPQLFNRGLDCDVLVSEVRDTSHKPDEVYGLIERLAPGQRKVELFGRMHNVQPNWVTLGNQLSGVNLVEPDVARRFQEKYPTGVSIGKPKPKTIPTVIDVTPQQGGADIPSSS